MITCKNKPVFIGEILTCFLPAHENQQAQMCLFLSFFNLVSCTNTATWAHAWRMSINTEQVRDDRCLLTLYRCFLSWYNGPGWQRGEDSTLHGCYAPLAHLPSSSCFIVQAFFSKWIQSQTNFLTHTVIVQWEQKESPTSKCWCLAKVRESREQPAQCRDYFHSCCLNHRPGFVCSYYYCGPESFISSTYYFFSDR